MLHALLIATLVVTMVFLFPFSMINRTFSGSATYGFQQFPAGVNARTSLELLLDDMRRLTWIE